MNIIFHKNDSLESAIILELTNEDYITSVIKNIQNYRSKVNLKGFRKGQTPYDLVKKMHGPTILFQTIMEKVSESVHNYVTKNSLSLWGNPLLLENPLYNISPDVDLYNLPDLEFKFACALVPEIALDKLEQATADRYEITSIADDTVKESIHKAQVHYGTKQQVTESIAGDLVNGILTNLTAHNIILNLPADTVVYNREKEIILIGVQPGNKITLYFDANQSYKPSTTNSIDKKTAEILATLEGEYEFTVENIYRTLPAELNKTFFANFFEKEEILSTEQFIDRYKSSFIKHTQTLAESLLTNTIKQAVTATVSFELPETFIKKQLKSTNTKWDEDTIESFYTYSESSLRWELITEKIAKENAINISIEEMVYFIKNVGYDENLSILSEESLRKKIEESFATDRQDRHIREVYNNILQEKVLLIIKDKITIITKEVSVEEFNTLMNSLSTRK